MMSNLLGIESSRFNIFFSYCCGSGCDGLKTAIELERTLCMSDVLLIGGGGYVGSAISYSLLQNGNSVTVYDNFIYGHRASINWALQDKGFRFRHGDLLTRTSKRF